MVYLKLKLCYIFLNGFVKNQIGYFADKNKCSK